jgi:hypothetical protein
VQFLQYRSRQDHVSDECSLYDQEFHAAKIT